MFFFGTTKGTEILAGIIVNKVVTTDNAIQRFAPPRRDCYLDKEFMFRNLVSML